MLLIMCSIFISSVIYASPLGGDPTQGYCQTVDGSACGWGGGSNQPRKIINIPSRYGSIALDKEKLILGASEHNLKSMRAAKKEAVQSCINMGGSKNSCKVLVSTRNGCLALALGSKGSGSIISSSARDTLQQAENEVMHTCRENGGKKCHIAYSKCSRDPRYQVGR
ncbi:DUF4189 domain-containing protein [Neisseria dentiae]|nr:DUF4189 domain-containing protein [Neisseria dentiae]